MDYTLVLTGIGVLFGGVLAFCTLYQTVLALASIPTFFRSETPLTDPPTTRFLVLIPAHNEHAIIASTVASVLQSSYPAALRDVVVIADNCTDDTAALAAAAGARCLVRQDVRALGKPHALAWAITQTDIDAYDAFVVVDGDTTVDALFLKAMDRHIRRDEHALQGYYGVLNPDENWLTRLGVLPATLKFRLHFPGKRVLGLSCPLAGNGMCFSTEIIRRFGWNAFSITENWEYYVILTLNGYTVRSAPEAVIYAQVARSLKLGQVQRMRWMKGQLETMAKYWRPLLRQGLTEPSLAKLDALFEVARPSHSILLVWSVAFTIATILAWAFGGASAASWPVFGGAILAAQVLYFAAGLVIERPPLRTWLALALVPAYLCWKLGIGVVSLLTLGDRRWLKTTRH